MKTDTESVTTVYDENGAMVAIIKRDFKSKKSLVYMTREAKVEDIARLIGEKFENGEV